MTSNLIPFPRRWFAEQIEQSEPFVEISAKLTEMAEDISCLRRELTELRADVEGLIAEQRAVGRLPEVDCDGGCACGFGSDEFWEAMLPEVTK